MYVPSHIIFHFKLENILAANLILVNGLHCKLCYFSKIFLDKKVMTYDVIQKFLKRSNHFCFFKGKPKTSQLL